MRPNTEGCTEWSCVYHGVENRFKSGHAESCPVRSLTGFLITKLDPGWATVCNCYARPRDRRGSTGSGECGLPGREMTGQAEDE